MPDFSDSDDESNSEFEKFIESIRTPLSKAVVCRKELSESEDEENEFLKFVERMRTPHSTTVKPRKEISESEDEDEFQKFCERIRTPLSTNVKNVQVSNTTSPGFPEKQRLIFSSNGHSESDLISTNVPDNSRITVKSQIVSLQNNKENISSSNGKNRKYTLSGSAIPNQSVIISSDSDDEELEFLKFSERIRHTPQCQSIFHVPKNVAEDQNDDHNNDDVFLKLSSKMQKLCAPRSQSRSNTASSIKSKSSSEGSCTKTYSGDRTGQHSLEALQSRNKEEFYALFPSASESSLSFGRKREKYAHQLYEFFNRKIFDYQLPEDMRLIWDNSLVKTAGLCVSSCKSNVYTCVIKLSSKLLISFDRLRDTLLHEMCHAAVWIINNMRSVGHGPLWKIWGSRCKMILPFIECPERCHTYDVPYNVWYKCLSCNWKIGRCRYSQKLANNVCKKCKKPVVVTRT